MSDGSKERSSNAEAVPIGLQRAALLDCPCDKSWAANIIICQVSGDRLVELPVAAVHDPDSEGPHLDTLGRVKTKHGCAVVAYLALEVKIVVSSLLRFTWCSFRGRLFRTDAGNVLLVVRELA